MGERREGGKVGGRRREEGGRDREGGEKTKRGHKWDMRGKKDNHKQDKVSCTHKS